MEIQEIKTREEEVLRTVIHHYILTAQPVSSRIIAKRYGIGLSSASIRNVMADLEDAGYLTHPHTSAGRVPTTKGYRLYVNNLMHVETLAKTIKRQILEKVETIDKNADFLLDKTAEILSKISHQLGVVIGPSFDHAVIEQIRLINVASDKMLIVISLRSGIIKSVVVEMYSSIEDAELDGTSAVLNERLSGMPLRVIRETISERLSDVRHANTEIVRLFIDSANQFFQFDERKIFIGGTKDIAEQPEFSVHEKLKSIIELVEQKDVIVHLLSRSEDDMGLVIKIGDENNPDIAKSFSIVSTQFNLGDQTGTLGVIGPMRMWYPKMVPLVDYTAEVINTILK